MSPESSGIGGQTVGSHGAGGAFEVPPMRGKVRPKAPPVGKNPVSVGKNPGWLGKTPMPSGPGGLKPASFFNIWPLARPNIAKRGPATYDFSSFFAGPGLGPGAGPGPGPGACEEGWEMLFFSNGVSSRGSTHNAHHPPTHFWTLQYRKRILANGESLYPHLWCGWIKKH